MALTTHAIIGTGYAPRAVITEGLRDVLSDGDAVALVWEGKPTAAMEFVYDYITDNSIPFFMYYEDGANPPRIFRESEFGTVQKVRHATQSAIQAVAGKGKILFLWDVESDDSQIDPVFDHKGDGVLVLELTNGLDPITIDVDIPEPKEREVEKEDEVDEDDTRFTKDELTIMTAGAVKRYGQRLGVTATTKGGIIEELFPDDNGIVGEDEGEAQPAAVVVGAAASPSNSPRGTSFQEDLDSVLNSIRDLFTNLHEGRY